jgi:hypothetical protein
MSLPRDCSCPTDTLDRKLSQPFLLSLPLETRETIWRLVLNPTVIFFVEEGKTLGSDYNQNLPAEEKSRRNDYVTRLAAHYGLGSKDHLLDENYKPPQCESIERLRYTGSRDILGVNKQIRSEVKAIMSKFTLSLESGLHNRMFQEGAQRDFLRLLANGRIFFNCHPFEFWAFLHSSPPAVLENTTTLVLGGRLLLGEFASDDWANYYCSGITLPEAYHWESESEPTRDIYQQYMAAGPFRDRHYDYYEYNLPPIIQHLDRLSSLKTVVWYGPRRGNGRPFQFYTVVILNFCRMLAAGKIKKLQILEEFDGPPSCQHMRRGSFEPPLKEHEILRPFFVDGVKTSKSATSRETETIVLEEFSTHEGYGNSTDWGVQAVIGTVTTVRRAADNQVQSSTLRWNRVADAEREALGMSAAERKEQVGVLEDKLYGFSVVISNCDIF